MCLGDLNGLLLLFHTFLIRTPETISKMCVLLLDLANFDALKMISLYNQLIMIVFLFKTHVSHKEIFYFF